MSKIDLDPITSGYNLSKINSNFQKIEDTLNQEVLYRKNYVGEPNEMRTNLDMNGNKILNVVTGTGPSDLATRGYVDEEVAEERVYVDQQLGLVNSELDTKYDKTGGPVFGDINLNGHKLIGASEVQTSKTSTSILEINGVPVVPGNSVIDPYNGTREALRRSYAEAGYNLVDGSFEAGGVLVNANDVLLQETTGKGFTGPAGTVAAGTVPSWPNYINRGDETLRSDLANPDKGAAMVARSIIVVNSVSEMIELQEIKVSSTVQTKGYYTSGDGGGNVYEIVAGGTGTEDGGSFIDLDNGLQARGIFIGDALIKQFGAKGDGVFDDTPFLQNAFNFKYPLSINDGTYKITSSLDLSSFTGGAVSGNGTIKSEAGLVVQEMLRIDSNTSPIYWSGVCLDMSQTSTSTLSDPVTIRGITLSNARNVVIEDCEIKNVREGRPIYISGSSSNTGISDSDGSKYITVRNVSCHAFAYGTVDRGAYCVVSSDFYTGDNGGTVFSASNAVNVSDFSIDQSLTFPATTESVAFINCNFSNHDRFALLNCKNITFTDCVFKDFYTRGINASPTVSNMTMQGGCISGHAAKINLNYACQNLSFSNITLQGGSIQVGEKKTLGVGYGTENVSFTGLTGSGNPAVAIKLQGAKNVSFSDCHIHAQRNRTDYAIQLAAHPGTSYITEDITFNNCSFTPDIESADRYIFPISAEAGVASEYRVGSIKVSNTSFYSDGGLFSHQDNITDGCFVFDGVHQNNDSSPFTVDPRVFMYFSKCSISMLGVDSVTLGTDRITPTFPNMRYYAPTKGADADRNPSVLVYHESASDGAIRPLLYGIHWFLASGQVGIMQDKIRLYDPAITSAGDKIHIIRLQ